MIDSLRLYTIINGEQIQIDIFGDDDIILEMSFAEIQDITKKNSNFSKSFKLPGSKNNNALFNHFYDTASTPITYDIREKFICYIEYDGAIIMTGYLRLNNVSVIGTEKLYDITFYSSVGDLTSNIGDKYLYQLDLDYLTIPYTADIINYSQYNWDTLNAVPTSVVPQVIQDEKVYFPLLFSGYRYTSGNTIDTGASPLLSFVGVSGTFTNQATPVRYNYYRAAISAAELYTQIVEQNGYTIESNFLSSSYMKRWYLPLTFASEDYYLKQSFPPQCIYSQSGFTEPTQSITGRTNVSFYDIDLATTDTYKRINNTIVQVDNFSATTQNPAYIYLNGGGKFEVKITYTMGLSPVAPANTLWGNDFYIHKLQSNPLSPGIGTTIDSYSYTQENPDIENEVIVYLDGENYYAFDYITSAEDNMGNPRNPNFSVIKSFRLEVISGPSQVSNNQIVFNLEFPEQEYKQIEFLSGINNMFNLVVVPKVNEPNTLIVEPMVNFIGKGAVIDWTQKVNMEDNITISPITTLIDGTLYYNTKGDNDNGNLTFKTLTNRPYGSQFIQLNQDYKDRNIVFENMFCSSVDVGLDNPLGEHLTIPSVATIKIVQQAGLARNLFNSFRTLPRLIHKGVYTPIENWGVVKPYYQDNFTKDGYTYNHRFTTYPQAFTGFSHYINYNSNDSQDADETMFNSYPNMYDIYYKDYILDLTDEGNRLVKASVYLTPEEIKNIQFNEKILVRNQYYRLNRLSNYSLLEPGLADVELVKLTRDYTPTPVKCIKLTDCITGEEFYTDTDTSFGFINYINRYVIVKFVLLEYCVFVEEIDCNEIPEDQPRYNNILISEWATQNGELPVFTDCGCTIRGGLDITQQPYPSPTPTPTSSPTPTPTNPPPTPSITSSPTPTPSVSPAPQFTYNYVAQNCNPLAEVLYVTLGSYTGVSGTTIVSYAGGCWEIVASTTEIGIDTWYNTFTGCSECNSITPTPTASPTTTPQLTPTLTATPFCNCQQYQITNNNEESVGYSYIDCYGSPQSGVIPPNTSTEVCLCAGSLIYEALLVVVLVGSCGEIPLPTPTSTSVTPTPTPSVSPSPIPCCYIYDVTLNPMYYSGLFQFTDCLGNVLTQPIVQPENPMICVYPGTTPLWIAGDGSFVNTGICCGNPVPSSTPTNTPTSTQTPTITPTNTTTPSVTPTNTQTPTSTLTPTPTSGPCSTYDVYNPNFYDYTTEYIDCDGNLILFTTPAFQTIRICCKENTIVNSFFVLTITLIGTCPLPTPTPTQTPTNTQTPTYTPTNTPTITPSITPSSTPIPLFVAGGTGGSRMAYSNNGITWSGVTGTLPSSQIKSIATNGSIWLAGGGTSPTLSYSYDGLSWSGTTGVPTLVDTICWNGSIWVVGTNVSGDVYYSTNGLTWSSTTGTHGGSITTIAYNGSMFVSTGAGGLVYVGYSYDGLSWSASTSGSNLFNTQGQDVCWNGSKWVAVSVIGATNKVILSYDGITWTGSTNGNTIFDRSCNAICWNGTLFVARGDGTKNKIGVSYDGLSWTGSTNGNTIFDVEVVDIAWNGNIFVAAGKGITPSTKTLGYSYDGLTWSAATNSSTFISTAGQSVACIPAPYLYPSI